MSNNMRIRYEENETAWRQKYTNISGMYANVQSHLPTQLHTINLYHIHP